MKRLISPLLALLAAGSLSATRTHATSLLLDFGPTLTVAADATNSPGHLIGAIPLGEITWNRITGDTNTLYYGNGTAATGVSLNLGRSTAGVDTINFADDGYTSSSALGGSINTGVYAGTSPAKDAVFGGAGGANNLALGLRVDGLPAGTYTLIFSGRNTSTASAAPVRFYATNDASSTTYNFSTNNTNAICLNTSPAVTSGFVQGDNYNSLTVVVATGESLYLACEGTVGTELRGFVNTVEIFFGVPILPVKIATQPANRTVYEGAYAIFTAGVSGTTPITLQWRFNGTNNLTDGPNVTGATSSTLTLKNVNATNAGTYSLFASNAAPSTATSASATLTVTPILNTAQMSNTWNVLVGDRPYLGTGNTERGMIFNPLTTNLLLVSRQPVENVAVLDPFTGADKYAMNVTGIPGTIGGSTLGLNQIGVTDDGAVIAAGLSITANVLPYYIYRWPDDSSNNAPITVFAGDPGAGVVPNLRWGDNLAVRGAGADVQILIAPGSTTNVAILRSASGLNFQTEIPPAIISVSNVPSAFAQLGIAWGPGTNTFWAKSQSSRLYLIQFDLNTLTGTVLYDIPAALAPGTLRGIGVNKAQTFLGGVVTESPNDNARIYDISNLTNGVAVRDAEPFFTQNANNTGVGGTAAVTFGGDYMFALDSNNGIKAFFINTNYVPPSVGIVTHPINRTVLEGASVVFNTLVLGEAPLYYQWKFNGTNNVVNGPNVFGATSNNLVLHNISTNQAGTYSLFVSNNFAATATSSNAVLTVIPVPNTPQLSNVWTLLPFDRPYLFTNSTERGLAYNAMTTNLLLVSRNPAESVVVLDALTGAEKRFLDVTGVGATIAGTVLGLNAIGVADDGVVYAANLGVNVSLNPYIIYRWPNDNAGTPPTIAFNGDPAVAVQPGIRWGDNLAVRGAGVDTQILAAPGAGTNVVLFRTADGSDFQNAVPPAVITVTGVPAGFAQNGIAFGPGTNTFWGKSGGNSLYLIQYDLVASTGAVLYAYSTAVVPSAMRAISTDKNQKYMAAIVPETSDNVRLFDISDLAVGPIQRDEEVFASLYGQNTLGGVGATTFGGQFMYALDGNNGIRAYFINTNYVPVLPTFAITSTTLTNGSIVLTWPTTLGVNYQVQYKDDLNAQTWTDAGGTTAAVGAPLTYTSPVTTGNRFFRVRAQ